MNYNVLTEPWIPARHPDGSVREYGVLDLLEHAHELTEITDAMPNYEYGMYRFLFVFLMDAFHPKRQRDIRALLEKGSFDMDVIREYVDRCNQDGERFDLLDEKHPFMQQADGWDKAERKSPANLNPALPSGNNHVHFDHTMESTSSMTLKEAAKALCAINLFCAAGVQGYPSTPSGAPPVYTIVKGETLFQTLTFGMVPSVLFEPYDHPGAVWREEVLVIPKEKVASVSLLYGLLFPCRRVRLRVQAETVYAVDFEQGMNYENYEAWKDPFVTYAQGKQGRTNLKPNMDKENWRNLGTILNKTDGAPYVVLQSAEMTEASHIVLVTYSAVTNQMNYLDLQRGEYVVPISVLNNNLYYDHLCRMIQSTEKHGGDLSKNIYFLQKALNRTDGAEASERTRTMERYYFRCRQAFFEEMDQIPSLDSSKLNDAEDKWETRINGIRWSEYHQFVNRLGTDSRLYLEAEKIKAQTVRKEGKT